MGLNTNRLAYRLLSESDTWSAVVEKINFNFDQNKAFGGGDPGDRGFMGFRGLPGATGIGKKGDPGAKGATIAFASVALVDGQAVTDPDLRIGDVVIDTNGIFYSIIANNLGNPVYKFEYSLSSAVSGSIVETENAIASQSANPIVKWYLRTTGNPKDANAMFVDRVVGTVSDEAQLYRAVIGDSGYPLLQNSAFTIVNILPNATENAKDNFFAQLAFKYRSAPNSNVSSNTGYIRYLELNKNEVTPSGPDDTYMLIENISAGFGAVHDSLSTDASYALIRGRNARFTGKTSMDQLYNSGSINNANNYLDVIVETAVSRINGQSNLVVQALAGSAIFGGSTFNAFTAPKHFFNAGVYIGAGNYNGANNYVPANGAVIEGVVGIGYTGAPIVPASTQVKLSVAGDILMSGSGRALGFGGVDGDLDHVWFDDSANLYHFVADAAYKVVGNAGIRAGAVSAELGNFFDRIIVGAAGWNPGFAGGISAQGRSLFGNRVDVTGVFNGNGGATFNGANNVAFNNTSINASDVTGVDLRKGEDLKLGGAVGADFAGWRYWNYNSAEYDYLGYRGTINDWVCSWNGQERKVWHEGNMGPGSGLNADLLDGLSAAGFWRKNFMETGNFMQFRGTNMNGALAIHQDFLAARIQSWYAVDVLKAYMNYDGTLYAQDVWILSDKKLKKNIKPIASAIDIINKLNPVTFQWKSNGNQVVGLIAQEVANTIPTAAKQSDMGLSVDNAQIIPYLIKGLQEAFAEIAELKERLKGK